MIWHHHPSPITGMQSSNRWLLDSWKYGDAIGRLYQCIHHFYLQFEYKFELDHSSGYGKERLDELSTIDLDWKWGGKQQIMRKCRLGENDVGELLHDRSLAINEEQYMFFREDDLPPIFDPTSPKFDSITSTRNSTKSKDNYRYYCIKKA